jgi:hypothetical protein
MDLKETRREILNRVASGELSAETANRLLAALEDEIFQQEPLTENSELEIEPSELPSSEALPPSMENDGGELTDRSGWDNPEDRVISLLEPATSSPSPDSGGESISDSVPEKTANIDSFHQPYAADELDGEIKRRIARWQRAWVVPFLVGLAVTALGAFWMYRGWLAAGPGWGFWLSWIPFLLGVGLAVFAYASTNMPWLHLSVQENHPGRSTHINLTFPLPIRWAAWTMTHFERYMPDDLRDKNVADFLALFEKSIAKDQPFHVIVDDEDEHVDIAIFKM